MPSGGTLSSGPIFMKENGLRQNSHEQALPVSCPSAQAEGKSAPDLVFSRTFGLWIATKAAWERISGLTLDGLGQNLSWAGEVVEGSVPLTETHVRCKARVSTIDVQQGSYEPCAQLL